MQVCHFPGKSVYPSKTTCNAPTLLRVWVGQGIKKGLASLLTPGNGKSRSPGNPNPPQLQKEPGNEFHGTALLGKHSFPNPPNASN
jgi:hypothetical protein